MAKVEQRMTVVRGDITTLKVQGIVNAANGTLLGGGGVDGAIHKAAGPRLREECEGLDGCPTGEARITRGYHLPARYVIHAVGPVYRGGRKGEADQLAGCYRHSLKLAMEYALSSIAFPCISTGAYSYPPEAAARIAIRTVEDWLKGHELPEQIIFCCFLESDEAIYRKLLAGAG